jgi:DNA-binding transcriptional LysR family regulator
MGTVARAFQTNNLLGDCMDRLAIMETFVRVVETGSFTAAARHQNIRQPSVSKSIAQLEESLGVRLLMRSTRGVTPTEAGRSFCEQARRVIEQADEAVQAVRGVGAGLQGRLRVSVGTAIGKLHLMPLLPAFLAENPNLSIDLVLDDRPIDLIGEGIDLGLCFGPLRDSSLTARKLASRKRMVLGAPAYFEGAGIPTTPTELSRHAAVICSYDREGSDTWCFQQGNTELSISVSGRLRVSTSEGLRAAVLSGMGLANASQWMFEPELACGAVRAVLSDWRLPESELWAVFPAGRMPSVKARTFATFVESALRKHPPALLTMEGGETHRPIAEVQAVPRAKRFERVRAHLTDTPTLPTRRHDIAHGRRSAHSARP